MILLFPVPNIVLLFSSRRCNKCQYYFFKYNISSNLIQLCLQTLFYPHYVAIMTNKRLMFLDCE